jgi:hypothetical protein
MKDHECGYEPDKPVTLNSVSELIDDFLQATNAGSPDCDHFNRELRKHCLMRMNQQDASGLTFAQSDIGPVIYAFYSGYKAAIMKIYSDMCPAQHNSYQVNSV